ncbi:dTDP-4-dehydrorhamnose 3,5-epimerase [Rhodothalassium salexigens DSM 2132]|uniref:dTDP-4-dehydrorhamnose 3,5-epimerase n=1 Tax=Rhodothalassium salexigens DSM 2132 TaxID=1188247 RepID=A0A4V2SQF1_RHOSA|nr:dTDP-4-dehydrorhamnose 3,5-epimerase [Rhodothalassium salexigens]MBB4210422.1 dTDP-4-dehydrorhamnose 3,5-epimerase [Rhodothalassium salexigens DSM 2132]MBK1640070.1 dTDP-4-dehydrorhamnose 3,5-epimerase [Rhodothalassium salexigens DSM 2132]TCP38586.1 dTDP-4-dehydrorhamnose 3,5-epimerase [Rhodothalassium salexigens DSM 2132]
MSVVVEPLAIPDVKRIRTRRHGDARGFFSETYNARDFAAAGIDLTFVQDNHAYSAARHTVRGLHFQTPPHAQAKLVRVLSGAIWDVAVDLRVGSPSYGAHVALELSAESGDQILVPEGFAHGLVTLAPHTQVLYKVSAFYAPDHDRGLLWHDPALGIDWPVSPEAAIVSDKDRTQPRLADLPRVFA